MRKRPLSQYSIGVIIAWAVVLCGIWFFDPARFDIAVTVGGGFVTGMIAMYIAVHVYEWK